MFALRICPFALTLVVRIVDREDIWPVNNFSNTVRFFIETCTATFAAKVIKPGETVF